MIGVLVPGHAQLVALRGVAVGAVTSEVLDKIARSRARVFWNLQLGS